MNKDPISLLQWGLPIDCKPVSSRPRLTNLCVWRSPYPNSSALQENNPDIASVHESLRKRKDAEGRLVVLYLSELEVEARPSRLTS